MRMSVRFSGESHGERDYIGQGRGSGRDSSFAARTSPRVRSPLDVDCLFALVVTAVRTDAVRHLRLFAVGTLRESRSGEGVVRAALVATGLAMASFGIRHYRPTLSC